MSGERAAHLEPDPARLAAWLAGRRAGRVVGLANGCFDLLHVGHLRMLRAAREEVDLLVVALNVDATVRAAKGPDRPLVPLAERLELVAGLRVVDAVTSFAEPTAHELVRLLRPEVYVKGTDRTPETVPEREVVEACGGRLVFLGDEKTRSSTDLGARRGR